jgi:hypothetical protein
LEPNPKGIKHFTKGNKINHRRLEEGEKNKLEKKKKRTTTSLPNSLAISGGMGFSYGYRNGTILIVAKAPTPPEMSTLGKAQQGIFVFFSELFPVQVGHFHQQL